MAITLGTFTKQDDNSFTGTLKTLNVTANLSIVPVAKASDNAPDHRVYAGAGQRPPARQGRAGFVKPRRLRRRGSARAGARSPPNPEKSQRRDLTRIIHGVPPVVRF